MFTPGIKLALLLLKTELKPKIILWVQEEEEEEEEEGEDQSNLSFVSTNYKNI